MNGDVTMRSTLRLGMCFPNLVFIILESISVMFNSANSGVNVEKCKR